LQEGRLSLVNFGFETFHPDS
jgi:hypothetical protein